VRLRADNLSATWLARWAHPHPAGFIYLDVRAWQDLGEPLARRILSHCIISIGGHVYPPRGERLTRLADALRGSHQSRSYTLGGCLINLHGGRLTILREPGAVALPVNIAPGGEVRWDGRFRIHYMSGSDPLVIGALGDVGWRQLPDDMRRSVRRISSAARRCLPAIRRSQDGPPLYVHHIGVSQDAGTARICTQFSPMLPLSGPAFGNTSLFPTIVALS
jgi:tRNA(Ile)-lysidine synthase